MPPRRPHRIPRPHTGPPSRRGRFFAWVTAALATALAAIVVAALNGAIGKVTQKVTEPSSPLQVDAAVDRTSLSVVFPGIYAMPSEMQIDAGTGGATQGVSKFEDFRRHWLAAGASHFDEAGLGITIRMLNRGQRRARVIGLEVVDLVRKPPLDGTLLHLPGQGGVDVFRIAFDLDETTPVPHGIDKQGQVLGSFFHRQELELSRGDRDTIWVPVLVSKYSTRFRLRLSYLAGDSRTPQHVTLDENGRPFALTAPNCVNGLHSYRRIYSSQSPDLRSLQGRMTQVPSPAKYWAPALETLDPCPQSFAVKIKQLMQFAK